MPVFSDFLLRQKDDDTDEPRKTMSVICLGERGKILIDLGEVVKFTPAPSSGQINTARSNTCLSAAVKLFSSPDVPRFLQFMRSALPE